MGNTGTVIGDTCFWIAVFDDRESHHKAANKLLATMRPDSMVMPWPLMYEVLRTRTVKRPPMVRAFEKKLPSLRRIDDTKYRDQCLSLTIASAREGKRSISLVDMVVRAIISDAAQRIGTVLTYNPQDFLDVCKHRGVEIWPSSR